jgi:hypothetical protein
MKVGDLVRTKHVDGKPIGCIVKEGKPTKTMNGMATVYDVLVRGGVHRFGSTQLEVVNDLTSS